MALMTTIALVSAITIAACTAGTAAYHYATEDDRARAEIAELKQAIKNCDATISSFESLKEKLNEGKDYLYSARYDFLTGGHVLNDEPLANDKFLSCDDKIVSAIANINTIISNLNKEKEEMRKKIKELEKKL